MMLFKDEVIKNVRCKLFPVPYSDHFENIVEYTVLPWLERPPRLVRPTEEWYEALTQEQCNSAPSRLQGPPYILARKERLFFTNLLLV